MGAGRLAHGVNVPDRCNDRPEYTAMAATATIQCQRLKGAGRNHRLRNSVRPTGNIRLRQAQYGLQSKTWIDGADMAALSALNRDRGENRLTPGEPVRSRSLRRRCKAGTPIMGRPNQARRVCLIASPRPRISYGKTLIKTAQPMKKARYCQDRRALG